MSHKWWMECIGYQIYPKSFYDSNHDGIGDLNGIIEKLDYLKDLGVNLLWICPFYDSPMHDNGYDVRNFFDVEKSFGTMEDCHKLIQKAHALDIKIILDFVLNHTSDEHPWFIESKKSKDNPYRDYYIWHDGIYQDGLRIEPTNWGSFFGGSAWNYDEESDSFYMKIFANEMPDLNWSNPMVRKEMMKIAETWISYGIDGFRIDAISHLDRAPFEDAKSNGEKYPLDWFKFSNLPKVHDYLKEMHQEVFSKHDILTIGEVGGEASISEGLKYAGFDRNELSMVFNFDHNWCNNIDQITTQKQIKVNVLCLKKAFSKWQEAFKDKGWLPLNWLNHDQPRLISHYGNLKYFKESGKMLATLLYLKRGTPFIYQGEEIGMTNYPFDDVSEFNDVSSIASYRYHLEINPDDPKDALRKASIRSRDNARTPMQWSNGYNASFSTAKPYMKPNPNYKKINVLSQLDDKDSLLNHYKKLIDLRKNSIYKQTILYGDYTILDPSSEDTYVYLRRYQDELLLVVNSFTDKKTTYDLSSFDILDNLLSNYKKLTIKNGHIVLKPYESVVFKVKEKS